MSSNRVPTAAVYQDEAGQWRWRLKASNGRIIAASAEGFKQKFAASRALKAVLAATSGDVKLVDGD